ncbi:MAG: hypothetical protein JWM53_934 [bacterium]|nr:hypothetical protein [bacterium]
MLYRNASIFAFACMLGAVGCRDNGAVTPVDLSMAGGGGGGTGGGSGGDMATAGMKTYIVATIAMMRQGAPGDYELDDVVAIALTSSTTSPHLYAQDAAGGDFSAIKTNCSSSSTSHPCTVASTVHTVAVGHKVTIKGTYIKASAMNGGSENFYIDSITDNGAGTLPAVKMVALTDVQRNATTKASWFQHVQVSPAPAAHKVYDVSPTELAFSGATKCPYQLGFGLAPAATAGAGASQCVDMTSQPAAATAPDPTEVLIGTDFFTTFKMTSDCRCYTMFTDTPVTTAMSTTKLGGILIYDTVFGSMPAKGYQYLSPLDNTTDVQIQ